jgi:hypothetical protein
MPAITNVVSLRPTAHADRLERIARRPLQPRRDYLLWLASRVRALEALDGGLDEAGCSADGSSIYEQLDLEAA